MSNSKLRTSVAHSCWTIFMNEHTLTMTFWQLLRYLKLLCVCVLIEALSTVLSWSTCFYFVYIIFNVLVLLVYSEEVSVWLCALNNCLHHIIGFITGPSLRNIQRTITKLLLMQPTVFGVLHKMFCFQLKWNK